MRTIWTGLVVPLALAGCGGSHEGAANRSDTAPVAPAPAAPPPMAPVEAPVAVAPPTDAWIGKWVGVEGLALTIARGDRPGTYRLHIALMDGANDYIGAVAGDGIRFERDGRRETIRATDGAATGLKWLADRKTCLTIREGEGFCRD